MKSELDLSRFRLYKAFLAGKVSHLPAFRRMLVVPRCRCGVVTSFARRCFVQWDSCPAQIL